MIHPDLAARVIDERLPRYTSYPTAPHFTDAITRETYEDWLADVPSGSSGSRERMRLPPENDPARIVDCPHLRSSWHGKKSSQAHGRR